MNIGYRYLISPLNRPWRRRGELEVRLCCFLNLGARWGWRSKPLPGRFAPGQETWYSRSDIYWNVPTWKCAIAHFSVHYSMRPARNVLTAIRVINGEELEPVNRQTDRVVVNLSYVLYSGSCQHTTSQSAYQHYTEASGNLQLAGADRNGICN